MSPPNRAVVLCVDAKSRIQVMDREQPAQSMVPGVPKRRTHSYVRNAMTSLSAAFDIATTRATGAVIGKCYKRHRATEFLDFLKRTDERGPRDGQLRHAQDAEAQDLAGAAVALAFSLHADISSLDQLGRAPVRQTYA